MFPNHISLCSSENSNRLATSLRIYMHMHVCKSKNYRHTRISRQYTVEIAVRCEPNIHITPLLFDPCESNTYIARYTSMCAREQLSADMYLETMNCRNWCACVHPHIISHRSLLTHVRATHTYSTLSHSQNLIITTKNVQIIFHHSRLQALLRSCTHEKSSQKSFPKLFVSRTASRSCESSVSDRPRRGLASNPREGSSILLC